VFVFYGNLPRQRLEVITGGPPYGVVSALLVLKALAAFYFPFARRSGPSLCAANLGAWVVGETIFRFFDRSCFAG